MKHIHTLLILSAFVFATACADFVDVVPDNVATIDYAFRDKVGAEKFLATCYSYLPNIGNPANDPAIMGSEETWNFVDTREVSGEVGNYNSFYIKKGLQNTSDPYNNYWDGMMYGGRGLFQGIRNCNIFLENADKVGIQLQGEELERWKAEVKVLKAYFHFYLMRMYGPIPLMKENIPVDSTPEEVRVYRDPWDDCVDYVVSLLDEAAPHLPLAIEDRSTEMGRITRPAALGIKAVVLVTSASPLFNGNADYVNVADNRGVKLFTQSYDASKWEKAATACKQAIDVAEEAGHKLYTFAGPYSISDDVKLLNSIRCVYSDRYNEEMIWCAPKSGNSGNLQRVSLPHFTSAMLSTNPFRGMLVPSMRIVEKFYSENGVPIDEDKTYDYEGRYSVAVAPADKPDFIQAGFHTAKLHMNREPRFYADIAFDGSYWWGNGTFTGAGWKIGTRQGDPAGKTQSVRYTITGYWNKKGNNYQTTVTSSGGAQTYNFSPAILRLADLYLLYAEARNESLSQPDDEVYTYVDKVREHAGLSGVVESWENYSTVPNKPQTKEGMRAIIHRERDVELCFESKHFWDVRRWKTAMQEVPGAIIGWNIDANSDDEYYTIKVLDNLTFTTKEYLWPIRTYTLRVNTNLVQNPYWE